jgi:hypothetical protein
MPSGASTSSTAFIVAPSAPTIPASPALLMPSELVLHGTLRRQLPKLEKSPASTVTTYDAQKKAWVWLSKPGGEPLK